MLCEHGFSTYTSLPAWHAQMVCMVCKWLGVASEMASIDLSSSSLRRSVTAVGAFPRLDSTKLAALFNTSWSTSHTATRSTFGKLVNAFRWDLPRPRSPAQAMRTVSLGFLGALRAVPIAAADVMKKSLRFIGVFLRILLGLVKMSLPKRTSAPPKRSSDEPTIEEEILAPRLGFPSLR